MTGQREIDSDDPRDYGSLTDSEKARLLGWIKLTIRPARTVFADAGSRQLKTTFYRKEFYVTNGQFKGAMLVAGYRPVDPNVGNWKFRIRLVADGPS